jgi:hypothetical protein
MRGKEKEKEKEKEREWERERERGAEGCYVTRIMMKIAAVACTA